MDVTFEGKTSTGTDEWLTPLNIIKALGEFDLDPCSPIQRPWDTAKKHYTINDNGLLQNWEGRVWCNPPYGEVYSGQVWTIQGERVNVKVGEWIVQEPDNPDRYYPIATDRIKNIDKVEEYISSGLLRRVSFNDH